MKSNNTMVGIALLCLAFATISSVLYWGDVSSAAKIGMYAFGFGTGVAAGALNVRRKELS